MAKGLLANPINNAAQMQAAMVLLLAAQSQQNGHQHQSPLTSTEKDEKKSPLRRNPLLPNPPLRKSLLPTPTRNEFPPTRKNPHWDNEESQGKSYWKTPLLGDRPRGYLPDTPTSTRSPLLGDRPPPSSLSPTSSVSSLASDIADRNTLSPSLINSSAATPPPRTPEAVAQLHSQLESLGNNPLMNLLLQAAQKSNNNTSSGGIRGSGPLLASPVKCDGVRRSLLGDFPGSVPWMSMEKRKFDEGRDFREINKMCGEAKRVRK